MSFLEYGVIAEILASIATITTLFYLAVQIRAASRIQISQSRRAVHDRTAMLANVIGQDLGTANVWRRGLVEFDGLNADEKVQFIWLFSQLVGHADLAFADHRLGLSEDNYLEDTAGRTFEMMRMPGGRAYWEYSKSAYSKDFRQYVEEQVLAE